MTIEQLLQQIIDILNFQLPLLLYGINVIKFSLIFWILFNFMKYAMSLLDLLKGGRIK